MRRRRLLQWLASAAAVWPMLRARVRAANELSADEVLILRDVGSTVLPVSRGPQEAEAAVDDFLQWLRDYREGVPLSHGYGAPRLVRTGPSPVAKYGTQLRALQASARRRGGRFGALPLEDRRSLLDEALKQSGVNGLPVRPEGRHVAADLMAHYFRGSHAADVCYNARIGRNTLRSVQSTTVRPAPLTGGN